MVSRIPSYEANIDSTLMSGVVLYKSATIKRCDRKVKIVYLTPSFDGNIENERYKLDHRAYSTTELNYFSSFFTIYLKQIHI